MSVPRPRRLWLPEREEYGGPANGRPSDESTWPAVDRQLEQARYYFPGALQMNQCPRTTRHVLGHHGLRAHRPVQRLRQPDWAGRAFGGYVCTDRRKPRTSVVKLSADSTLLI